MKASQFKLEILGLFPTQTSPWKSAAEIAAERDRELKATRRTLAAMLADGLMEDRRGLWRSSPAGRAVLAAAGRATAPRRDLRQRLWSALRRLKKATVQDLVTIAQCGESQARHNTQRYLRALGAAGYLKAMPRSGRGHPNAWLLVRDTGPRAPSYSQATRTVTDRNTGEVHHVGQ